MRKIAGLTAFVVLGAAMMFGQATRTWVSGVGDDANPCSRTAPCKTFAGAISKTAPGGEIDALDPGGFGALTITKSITIDGGGGQVASVLVAGTNGIVVAAGAGDVVILRNLRFSGLLGGGNANAGLNGIRFISGRSLNVESCVIFGFSQNGIDININSAASVHIINTTVANVSQNAASGLGVGIRATSSSGVVQVGIDHSTVTLATTGIEAAANSRVVVNDSFVEHASGDGLLVSASNAQMSVRHTDSSYNTNGFTASGGGFGNTVFSNYGYNASCNLKTADGSSGVSTNLGNTAAGPSGNCGSISTGGQF
jgi:hypothetical protein